MCIRFIFLALFGGIDELSIIEPKTEIMQMMREREISKQTRGHHRGGDHSQLKIMIIL